MIFSPNMDREQLLAEYHRLIACTPMPRREDYVFSEKWLAACNGRESVIQQYSQEYTAAVLALS